MARATLAASASPTARRDAVRSRLAEVDAEALLVCSLPNIRYLSGFTGSAAVLIVRGEPPDLFLTDFRYREQAAEEGDAGVEIVSAHEKPTVRAREILDERGVRRIAFERQHMSVAEWEAWRGTGAKLIGVDGWVEALRAVKAPAEVEAIRRAAQVADRVFAEVLDRVQPGVTERELAAELDYRLVSAGAERPAFETIVAAGERAALPHARPTQRPLTRGDVVLFDYGATVDGYHSDVSRTVACGSPPAEIAAAYEVVIEAQRAAIEGLAPGLGGAEADALARDRIERAGFGDRFLHGLGHGIGLEVHEAPKLGRTSQDRLESHTVVTIEPGIYIERIGGVRVEDDVFVGPRGVEVLTAAPKDALIIL